MNSSDHVLKAVASHLKNKLSTPDSFRCEWLSGDASNRSYARLHFSGSQTLILMMMNAPEAFKSEEVNTSNEQALSELPFVTIARALTKEGVRVPKILEVAPDSSWVVLEDFGDELLWERRKKEPALFWYEKALEELVRLQKVKPFFPVQARCFTPELFHWETEHFIEYALLKRFSVSEKTLQTLRSFFQKCVQKISVSPVTFVHRDYHSKNLMILEQEKRVGVIDFQDALLGPNLYDCTSFLRDSYVRLSSAEENHCLQCYEKLLGKPVNQTLFGLMSVQRNLKAVGRFFYISIVKKKDTHLPFVKPTLLRVFQTLEELNEKNTLQILKDVLSADVQ